MRPHLVVLVFAIIGGTACSTENTCGRTRSVWAQGTTPQVRLTDNLVTVIVAEADDRGIDDAASTISWDVPVTLGGDPISAVHLHNRNAGHDEGILYVFPQEGPEGRFIPASNAIYDYPMPVRTLFEVTRAGRVYLDIHTAAHPEGAARADLVSVNVQDWVSYYCD